MPYSATHATLPSFGGVSHKCTQIWKYSLLQQTQYVLAKRKKRIHIHTFISLNLSITIVCTKVFFFFLPYSLWLLIHNINTGGHESSSVRTSRETNTTGIKETPSLSDVCRHKADTNIHTCSTLHYAVTERQYRWAFFCKEIHTLVYRNIVPAL